MSDFDDEHHGGGKDDVRRRARERLMTEGAEVGVATLIELAQDRLQKGSTRGAAAKALVQSSGSTAPMLSQEDLADLPPDQIRVLLAEAQRALAAHEAKMKTIEHTPTAPEAPARFESGPQAEPAQEYSSWAEFRKQTQDRECKPIRFCKARKN